jgi:DNA-directed RNA polymerase subunit K/omega
MCAITVVLPGEKIKNDRYIRSKYNQILMANSVLTYTKQPFDECGKVLASFDKSKISKMNMTKYEFNAVISLRTSQLSLGSIPNVSITEPIKSNMDLRKIALEELRQGVIPFAIKRPLPNNKYEYVRITDLNLSAVRVMMEL